MTGPGALVAGRYRLRSQLGGGGMGAVWLARDELLGRDVAVKQVLVPAGIDAALAEANREAAMREGRIAARLSHAHAVSVYDMVLDEGQPWLVMEYLPSVSLAALLHDRGVLPIAQVAQIGAQVADALAATHAAGVIHRDVKPGNILIGEGPGREGLVKITDFGISRAVGDVSLTQTGVVKGTPAFLAPEVAQGSPPDEASDVFSLGATLYACLEGMPPFGLSDNALQMLHRVAGGEFQPPQQAGALTAPLMRMLSADPTARPTMPQVRDQLAKLAAGPDQDVTDVLTARTLLPKTLPRLPVRRRGRPPATSVEPVAVAQTPTPLAPTPLAPTPRAQGPRTPEPAEPAASAAPPVADRPGARPATAVAASASGVAPSSAPTSTPAPAKAARSAPSAPSTTPPSAPAPGGHRRKRWLAALAALLVAGVAAALLVVWLPRDEPSGTAADTPATSAPATPAPESTEPQETTPSTTEPAPGTTAQTTAQTTPPPPPEPAPEGPVTAAEMVTFVTDYYALLPGNTDAAYQRTGPRLRAAVGNSPQRYAGFWDDFRSVTLSAPQAVDGELVVNAQVTFVGNDGSREVERHRIELIEGPDGQLLVDLDVAV